MHQVRAICFALLLFAGPFCLGRDLAVVVNSANPTSALTSAELAKLLKAEVRSWPDGKSVRVFLTDPGSADTRMILQRAYKMAPEEIRNLVSARKAEIEIVGSDEIVLRMVDNNPGAIGIVNVYAINSHVKVLKVDDKLPMEPGYLLHGN